MVARRDFHLTPRGKEILQKRGGFFRHDATGYFDAMVELRVIEDVKTRNDSSALCVGCAINEPVDPGLNDCASAHGTGLDRDVESCSEEAVIPDCGGAFAERDHFSVSCWITIRDGAISRARNDAIAYDEYGAHGNFAAQRCPSRFVERGLHKCAISFLGLRHWAQDYHVNWHTQRTSSKCSD